MILPSGGTLCYSKERMSGQEVEKEELTVSTEEEKKQDDVSSPVVDIQAMVERVRVLKLSNNEYNARLAKILHGREERKQISDGLDTGDTHSTSSTLLDDNDDAALSYQIREEKENKKQYRQNLRHWASLLRSLEESRHRANKKAMELQLRLDEKETKGNAIEESFWDFKREIALAAENSRTGKSVPKKIIQQFERTEKKKDEMLEKVCSLSLSHSECHFRNSNNYSNTNTGTNRKHQIPSSTTKDRKGTEREGTTR